MNKMACSLTCISYLVKRISSEEVVLTRYASRFTRYVTRTLSLTRLSSLVKRISSEAVSYEIRFTLHEIRH